MNRRGSALIIVLWIMAILTLLMYAFLSEMRVEYAIAGNFADEKKAEQLAWSAIDLATITAVNDTRTSHALTELWADDESRFFELPLGDGACTVFRPTYAEDGRILWGLEDEASRIHINYASKEILMKLPRVTDEIADSIIDWRDQDSNPGPAGAESDYYAAQNPSYGCKNQPFETVEELLFVRGVTPEVLFGEDTNLNGRLDPNEDDGSRNLPDDDGDGRLDPGLLSLVTVVSVDRNVSADDLPRVNVNAAPPAQLTEAGLNGQEMQMVMAARARGGLPSLAHLLEFMNRERFTQVVDRLAIVEGETVPAMVNINTAPKPVLLALPGITEEIAVKILDYRMQPGVDLSNMGWLLNVTQPRELQQFAAYITFRSYQFRINAVGRVGTPEVLERPRAFKRMVAILDMLAEPRPRIVYWKDVTKLGMPYDPEDGPAP